MSFQKYDPDRSQRFTRKSLRFPGHDYTWTRYYFVTICAKVREPLFNTPELHAILQEKWQALPQWFPGITLDEFVIMPDHVHGIILLNGLAENAPALGRIVGAYKSLTTNAWLDYIKAEKLELSGRFWQRNYHERVLRDFNELEQKRIYIRENPEKLGGWR